MGKQVTDLQYLLNRSEPLPNWKWVTEADLFGLPGHYLESVDLPFNNIAIREGFYNASGWTYYPSTHNISAFGLVFYEDSEASTSNWLQQWKMKIKDFNTGLYNLPSEYKRDLKVYLQDTTGETVMTVTCQGIWPENTSNFSLNYTEAGRITVAQNFSCDNGIVEFSKPGKWTFK